jgi:drug/metabolite transporter (DMT)-like permease
VSTLSSIRHPAQQPAQHTTVAPRAYAALALGVFVFGFGAILVKWANAPGCATAFYRMAIAGVLVAFPFSVHVRRAARPLPRRGVMFAVLGGVSLATDLWLWATGVVMSGATVPTLMANTAPLWVGLATVALLRRRLPGLFWLGLTVALAGAVIVLAAGFSRGSAVGTGTALGLVAALFYAGYHLATERGRAHLSTLSYFWIATVSGAVFLFAVCLITRTPLAGYSPTTYLLFLALAVLVQIIGWISVSYVLGHLPASIVSPTLLGQPVVTALLAIPLLGERFSARQVAGGIAVLAGVLIVHRSRVAPLPPPPER